MRTHASIQVKEHHERALSLFCYMLRTAKHYIVFIQAPLLSFFEYIERSSLSLFLSLYTSDRLKICFSIRQAADRERSANEEVFNRCSHAAGDGESRGRNLREYQPRLDRWYGCFACSDAHTVYVYCRIEMKRGGG